MAEALAEARRSLEVDEFPVGAVVVLAGDVVSRAHWTGTAQRRLAYELFKVRAELAAFEGLFAAYLESPHGRFELWYAERERRRKRA